MAARADPMTTEAGAKAAKATSMTTEAGAKAARETDCLVSAEPAAHGVPGLRLEGAEQEVREQRTHVQ
jgi:hypothetical protein